MTDHVRLTEAGWQVHSENPATYRRGDAVLAQCPAGWFAGVEGGFVSQFSSTPEEALGSLRSRITRDMQEHQQELDALAEKIRLARQALEEIA